MRNWRVRNNKKTTERSTKGASKLYQFGSVYRHFILNKYAVVRGRFGMRSVKPYYLCTVVLFDISKDSDIVHGDKLLSEGVIDQ